jgi:hypothetical protein
MANGVTMDQHTHAYLRTNFLVLAFKMLKTSMMREEHWSH